MLLKRDIKKPGFKFNPEASLLNLQTTGPIASEIFSMHLYRIIILVWSTELIIYFRNRTESKSWRFIHLDEGLTLETSDFELFTVANLPGDKTKKFFVTLIHAASKFL